MEKNLVIKTNKKTIKFVVLAIILLISLFFLAILALCIGKYPISFADCLSILFKGLTFQEQTNSLMDVNVVLKLRLPRIIASILVGAALAVSGASYQGIFKNPLVSPDFLGVSSGACIGASIAILLGLNSTFISMIAFIGGIIAVLITASLPLAFKNRSNIMLVLSGVIVGSLMSSILGFLKYIADPASQLASITYWTMGSFSNVSNSDILTMLIVLLPPMIIIFLTSWWLDVLSMGENEAKTLGANVKVIKTILIICSTLLTAGAVCVSGTIGWVGLIIPHFSRMLVGSSNKKVIPISIILGGIFMLLVDTLTRVIGVSEMPISIMTGLIGVPFFIFLMYKRRKEIA